MSTEEQQNAAESENLCVVCFKTVDIYSYGICDHPVCYECTTRMRVLCQQNECPICRQDMPKVIFTKNVEPFSSIFPRFERSNLQDRRFGLVFCTSDIQKTYWKLLEHRCAVCDAGEEKTFSFRSFVQLKDHVRREHEMFYCDLCAENLKIFSFERRTYTRQELGLHRRKGDPDNTSHRGHPLCQFCDMRFMDTDDLYRHLRRQHLFCHFCDADGKHQYYDSMEDLKRHFREEHFFCEEGECREVPLTAVFRTDIDLKGHIAREHSRHMSKSAGKQARTLDIEFRVAPRPRPESARSGNVGRYANQRRDRIEDEDNIEPGGPGGGPEGPQFYNSLSSDNFPSLGGSSASAVPHRPLTTVNFTSKINRLSGAEFPTLGASMGRPSPAVTITANSSASRSNGPSEVTITRTVRGQQGPSLSKNQFPALGGSSSASSSGGSTVRLSMNNPQDSKVSIHVNQRPNGAAITTHITTTAASSQPKSTEAFPALGKPSPVSKSQWVQQKSKKPQEPKSVRVAPAPQLPPSDLQQFPTLPKNSNKAKKTSSVNVPVSQSWVNLGDAKNAKPSSGAGDSKNAKTDKSKQKTEMDAKSKSKKKKAKGPDATEMKSNNNESASINNNNRADAKGGVKKISELKIGTLSMGESSQISNGFATPNENKPPPGINCKPPPGFSNFNNFPKLGASEFPSLGSNNLTFTNSTGQSYAITPGTDHPEQQVYRQPQNFNARNQNLIKRFMAVLNDNDAIKEFKKYSDLFRSNEMPAQKYYDHCKAILGDRFEEIFPELLVLLPDIQKQQELYNVHGGKSKNNLLVCQNCRQIILKQELTSHYSFHTLDNHFPSLGKAQQVGNNAWRK